MRNFLTISCLLPFFAFGQSNTEIFLGDIATTNGTIKFNNIKNISNNQGYDNQPSFLDDRYIVFASTRSGQTDIAKYDTRYNAKIWINFTDGSEYSPIKIPNQQEVSAVRLDTDGKQQLYAYSLRNGESTELIKDLVVAYYTWADAETVVSAVIEDEKLNLYVSNIINATNKKYASNVGRSFHKIPDSDLISFISKTNKNQWQIKSLNPKTGKIKVIANTLKNVEDICWLDSKTLLLGKDNILYKLRLQRDNNWKKVADLASLGITKITRLATNASGTKLLLVGDIPIDTTVVETVEETTEESTEAETMALEKEAARLVEKHIEPFNNRRLDEFAMAFDANVIVNRFPRAKMYESRATLRESYKQFFKKNEKSHVKVINRMIHKNMVIDEELVTLNNTTERQVTFYETDADNIKVMTFLSNSKTDANPEYIVNEQLEVYNNRDIDGFVKTYTKDVMLFTFPYTPISEGQDALRKQYASFFKSTPDLNAEIVNRIVIGNKVIDKEKVKINGKTFYAIAIYEVRNELISRVTFIQ
ncbi:MAG: nuclear transport factor 2 family protein [Winogradskyella sp.]|uniref:nuclear transport factor 2 family protein n=1 Tax=Winogradskyella sp. TaxID=1883156 RepID=UPI00385B9569